MKITKADYDFGGHDGDILEKVFFSFDGGTIFEFYCYGSWDMTNFGDSRGDFKHRDGNQPACYYSFTETVDYYENGEYTKHGPRPKKS